jgi:hypothetical protein
MKIRSTPSNPTGNPPSSAKRELKEDAFGNTISWQKGDSGEKIKVFYSGDESQWKSGITKFEGSQKIEFTVPGSRWVITIPKKNPQKAHADNPFQNIFDRPVQLVENPQGFQIPKELKKERFAVFEDSQGKMYAIGINSLYFAKGEAQKEEASQKEQASNEEESANTPPTDTAETLKSTSQEKKPIFQNAPSNPLEEEKQSEVPPSNQAQNIKPPSFHPLDAQTFHAQPGEVPAGAQGASVGPKAAKAQEALNQALSALQEAEKNASPEEVRLLARYKAMAEAYASQGASMMGNGGDTARYFLPNIYCNLILQGARQGVLNNPHLTKCAKDYLQKENYLKIAYLQDAWTGIQQAWQSASPAWQKYYESRWNAFYGKTPDPWRAFAMDVVANAAPEESAMKTAAQNYLAYDNLRKSGMNPFLYPLAVSESANAFQQQQFGVFGNQAIQTPLGVPGLPNVLGGLSGNPVIQALYGNIQTSLAQMTSWIANLWGPPLYFYNFPMMNSFPMASGFGFQKPVFN